MCRRQQKNESIGCRNASDKSRRHRFWRFGARDESRGSQKSEESSRKKTEKQDKLSRNKSLREGHETSASPSVSVTTPRVTRVNSSSSKTTTTPKSRKAPSPRSRFSLRRLFYGNPLLAQPFLQATAGFGVGASYSQPGQSGSASNQRRGYKGSASSGRTKFWRPATINYLNLGLQV